MYARQPQQKASPPAPRDRAVLQRQCACGQHAGGGECETCRRRSHSLERRAAVPAGPEEAPSGGEATPAASRFGQDFSRIHSHAAGTARGGERLPDPVRHALEQSFRAPLSSVRVHAGASAARLAKENGAEAMALGEDIHFGRDRYQPHTAGGRRLLAHEISHVLQRRNPGPASALSDVESEAEAIAGRSPSAAALPAVRHRAAASGVPLRKGSAIREVIEDELDDVFFGIDNAWPKIRVASASERKEIRDDKGLETKIRKRASPMDLLKTYLLLTYGDEKKYPAHYTAFLDATDRLGTHEQRIFAILRGVTEDERVEMRAMPGFAETIDDEMSGSDFRLAMKLLNEQEGERMEDTATARTSTHLEKGERYDLDVSAREGLNEVQDKLLGATERDGSDTLLGDTSLWAQFADKFAAEQVWYLRMTARYVTKSDFPRVETLKEPFVKVIWDAVEPVGTDEDKLIDGLEAVNRATTIQGGHGGRPLQNPPREELKAEPWFVPMLESELSGGDLKRALAAVSTQKSGGSQLRDSLEDAIDHHDMKRIRNLLRDPKLLDSDRRSLQNDPVILDEMGEELKGADLCETSLLFKYGAVEFPGPVADFLEFFKKTPVDVAKAVAYLESLSNEEQRDLRAEPGVYFMLSDVRLPDEDKAKLLAAARSKDPRSDWKTPGSEGIYRTKKESLRAVLPVAFTPSEARITIRFNIDTHLLPPDYKLSSGTIEDWTEAIDDVWNHKYRVRSGKESLALVFAPYMAVGISQPDKPVVLEDTSGRSFASPSGMHLHLKGTVGENGLPASTVAHEFGHVLGNPDEYDLTPSEYQRITGKPGSKPPGGESTDTVMGGSRNTKIEDRNIGPAVEIINSVRDTNKFPAPFVAEKA
jgi:hypothetical protein